VERLGIHEATYRHAENGLRKASGKLLESAAQLYGVSMDFLVDGKAYTLRERLADRLTKAMWIVESNLDESNLGLSLRGVDFEWPARLQRIRLDSGYATAMAAAKAHGWSVSTYNAHELGTRKMSVERLLAYCLAMGGRLEHAVDGSMPVLDDERQDWVEHRSAFEAAALAPPSPGSR
jgi:hypothetical protein